MDAGLPDGPPRAKPRGQLDGERVKAAVRDLAEGFDQLEERQVVLLRAYLKGWRHHWPRRFSEILGQAGERCYTRVDEARVDMNRYLKLRRIAIENLSGVL